MKPKKNTLLTVSKMIAIGDLFSNGNRDRDRNFRDRVMPWCAAVLNKQLH